MLTALLLFLLQIGCPPNPNCAGQLGTGGNVLNCRHEAAPGLSPFNWSGCYPTVGQTWQPTLFAIPNPANPAYPITFTSPSTAVLFVGGCVPCYGCSTIFPVPAGFCPSTSGNCETWISQVWFTIGSPTIATSTQIRWSIPIPVDPALACAELCYAAVADTSNAGSPPCASLSIGNEVYIQP